MTILARALVSVSTLDQVMSWINHPCWQRHRYFNIFQFNFYSTKFFRQEAHAGALRDHLRPDYETSLDPMGSLAPPLPCPFSTCKCELNSSHYSAGYWSDSSK